MKAFHNSLFAFVEIRRAKRWQKPALRETINQTRKRARLRAALLSALAILLFARTNFAQTLLDSSFDNDGKAFAQIVEFNSRGNDAVLQSDGKIVVVGSANANPAFPQSFQIAVARFNPNGSLDTTFDSDGKLTVTFDASKPSEAFAVALQPDGKIVIAGRVGTEQSFDQDAVIVRLNPNGSLDTTFDNDGFRTFNLDVQNAFDAAGDLVVQADNKIVVAAKTTASGFQGFVVARINADGSLDASFGANGSRRISAALVETQPKLALQTDGKIVLAGYSVQNILARLSSDGSLDAWFGSGGIVNNAGGNAIVLQPDNKIIVVNNRSQVNVNVRRYHPNGDLDTAFGTNGATAIAFTNESGDIKREYDAALDANGKIVVGGQIRLQTRIAASNFDFAVARLDSNGALDRFFAYNGRFSVEMQGSDEGRSIFIQPDGKIVLAGTSAGGFSLARFVPATLNNSCRPVSDFDGDARSDLAFFDNTGVWRFMQSSNNNGFSTAWGMSSDRIVPADYDGDCRTDFAFYRNGVWRIKTSVANNEIVYNFGLADDVPIPADYDGDDLADSAIYRNGAWWINNTRDGIKVVQWGLASDVPVAADYDGDGKSDVAVYRAGVWWINQSRDGVKVYEFGAASDAPVVGDYDNDGKADLAVYRASEGIWYILGSTSGFAGIRWGIATDLPVPADYDGDGKTDVAIYRGGDWYLLTSNAGYRFARYGGDTDKPIQNAYIR